MTATEQTGPTGPTEPNMRQQIQTLIQEQTDAVALRYALEALAKQDPKAFGEAADLWALPLYEREERVFNSFLTTHLTKEHKDQIEAILPRAEADSHTHLFRTLYQHIADQERFNRDLLAIAQSDKSAEELKTALDNRHQYNLKLNAETALALYRRNPQVFSTFFERRINFSEGDFTGFREAVKQSENEQFYWSVFRQTANADLWRAELLSLLEQDISADNINAELEKRQPNRPLALEVEPQIWQRFIAKYGDTVVPVIERIDKPFFKQRLETLLKEDIGNETLLRRLEMLSRQQWQHFYELADLWVMALYERDPIFFQPFLKNHLRRSHKGHDSTIRALMSRLEADGRTDLFRSLYSYYFTEPDWNKDLLKLAQSDEPDEAVLEGLDMRSRSQFSLYIDTALALYRRNAALFGDFVRNRLRGQGRDLEKLSAEARRSGDEETFWALFREAVDNNGWQAEMESLLVRDIPADQIIAELEKRHPNHTKHIDRRVLNGFLGKYGEAVVPYLERHMSLVSRKRLESLLAIPKDQIDRGALLRELEKMARRQPEDFKELAWIWAHALYEREPVFFESFLVRNLDGRRAKIIHELLPRVEASGQDSLYKSLYRQIINESDWNYQIRTLAKSNDSDEDVKRAIERRDAGRWFTLSEDTAITLYERNTELFRDYVKQHLHPNWYNRISKRFLDAMKAAGDDELYWWMFRESAEAGEWEREMKHLLTQDIPGEQIVEELEKRLPSSLYHHSANVLLSFLEKYGAVIMPLIECYSGNLRDGRLLEVAERLGDKSIYHRLFFQHGDSKQWNKMLRELLGRPLPDDELMLELQRLTPDEEFGWNRWGWQRWQLETDVARALYERQPVAARPFLERFVNRVEMKLFEAANAAADEEFLDYLTFQAMREISGLVYRAYPSHTYWGWKQSDQDAARQQIAQLGEIVLRRFDELYAHSPETYIRHAANILGRLRAFEVWRVSDQLAHNPIFSHLATRHHEAWHRSPDGIRELMESPNIYVQLIGLEILSASGGTPDAAQRIVENKRIFQALLLGRTRRNTKKKVLDCLELAAGQGSEFAAELLPVLEATLDFRGKRAISERIIVSYARTRRAQGLNSHEVTA